MATRRLSSAGSFGEGLAQGFGLVNNLYDSRRKQDLAEQELAMDQEYRRGLIDEREERNRLTGLSLDNERMRLQNQATRDSNETLRLNSADIAARSQAGLRDAQAAQAKQQTKILGEERQRRIEGKDRITQTTNDFLAAQDVIDYYQAGQRDRASYDPTVMAELMKKVGGIADFSQHINPITIGNFEAFEESLRQLAETGVEPSQDVLLDMAATVFAKNRDSYDIGKNIDLQVNTAAPDWADGWKIVNKIPSAVKGNSDGTFSFSVDVEVQDPKTGKIGIYEAPMTEGADGSGISPSVTLTPDQLFKAAGGYIQYSRAVQPMKAAIQEAQKKSDPQFQNEFNEYDNAKYQQYMRESKLQFVKEAKGREDQESLIKGVTNQDLLDNPVLLEDYLLAAKYDPLSFQRTKATSRGDRMFNKLMELEDLADVEKQILNGGLPQLTRAQILELQGFVELDARGIPFVSDKKKFRAWRNRVTNRVNPVVVRTNTGGMQARQDLLER